jgi:hypothetical protein
VKAFLDVTPGVHHEPHDIGTDDTLLARIRAQLEGRLSKNVRGNGVHPSMLRTLDGVEMEKLKHLRAERYQGYKTRYAGFV